MDNSSHIKQRLAQILHIPNTRIEELYNICHFKKHNKNELINSGNRTFDRLGLILEGAARIYYISEAGNEISYLLQVNGDVVGDYASYITGQASNVQIQTLIKTDIIYFQKKDIDALIHSDVFWLGFAKMMSDRAFLNAKQRIDELFFFTPEQRYLNLLKKSPEIMHKIPQKHISTYLGITPQSLSRIRKRIC